MNRGIDTIELNKLLANSMLRTLIDCSRLMLESPWLMLLGFAVVVLPGGLLFMPILASKLRSAKATLSAKAPALMVPITINHAYRAQPSMSKSNFISFVPSVGKLR